MLIALSGQEIIEGVECPITKREQSLPAAAERGFGALAIKQVAAFDSGPLGVCQKPNAISPRRARN
jgi:hypothetical protein